MKKYKKSRLSFDEVIASSKFNYYKNMKWFLIAPAVIILVAIILLCTVGFKSGIDFTGGSVMTVYTNSENVIEGAEQYDANNAEDYRQIQDKIDAVLEANGLSASSYQISSMDVAEFDVYGGQAVVVKYQNAEGATSQEIIQTNNAIHEQLLQAFGYDAVVDGENAIENTGTITPTAGAELIYTAIIAVVVAMVLVLIYLGFRFDFTTAFACILALFHDIFITTAFALIFRITINPAFIIAIIAVMCFSIFNSVLLMDRIRDNQKSGVYDNQPNEVLVNDSVRQTMPRNVFIAVTAFVVVALVAVIAVTDVRDFALPIAIGVLASFYSSVFITPSLWALAHNPKKRKKLKAQKDKEKDKVVV